MILNRFLLFLQNLLIFLTISVIMTINNNDLKGGDMAKKAMTKSQIADHLANKAGITKKSAVQILDEIASLAYKEAKSKKEFTLPGLGKLVLVNRKARKGRNPQTGEEIKIPAKKVVKFRVAKACKDSVLGS